MWRLLVVILIFAVFLVFIGFNLDNSCDISFGFRTLPQVPVYLTAFSSFVLGMLFTFPFVFFFRKKKPREQEGIQTRRGKKGEAKSTGESPASGGETYGESGPYGIN